MSRTQRLRDQLYLLQGSRCFYCDNPIAVDDRSLEHVVPSCSGGLADTDNAVVVCEAANQLLGSATPKQKIIMLKAGGGKIECPKKCGERVAYTSDNDDTLRSVNSPKQVRAVNQQANVGRNQVQKQAAKPILQNADTTDKKPAKTNADGQTPMTAKQKQKARSGHQSMPRPTSGRRRR